MEFIESLRRLEEDVENIDDFEQLPVHCALEQRFRNTLYLGKSGEGISLPVADVAVDLFHNAADKKLGNFTRRHVAKFNRNGLINPSSSVLGMMYARRLKRQKSDYLKTVTSTELFLVSMMLATKFLYDEGEDEEIFNDEWAESSNMDVKRVNELEREFLDAIDWDLHIKPDEYYEFLQQMETWIALSEGQRRGWFSYSDFNVLMDHKDWLSSMAELLEQATKVLGICFAAYTLCSATLCWSLLVMQHQSTLPGIPPKPTNHSHSHVFQGLVPLKSTQSASHQSEIILPPVDVVASIGGTNRESCDEVLSTRGSDPNNNDELLSKVLLLCPNCRKSRCRNVAGNHIGSDEANDGLHHLCRNFANLDLRRSDQLTTCDTDMSSSNEFWLQHQIARARQATVSFYQAFILAYYEAASGTKLNEKIPPAASGKDNTPINQSANRNHVNREITTSHTNGIPELKCRHKSSNFQGMANNVDDDARLQCSVCDSASRFGRNYDTMHMMLPPYSDGVLHLTGASTGTIPVIEA